MVDDTQGVAPLQAERISRALCSHLRHELCTPVVVIIGFAEMLLEDERGAGHAEMVDDLGRVLQAARELNALIVGLLDPSALERDEDMDLLELGATIRHAVRTPLSAIIGYTELLLEDAPDGSQVAADLESIRGAAESVVPHLNEIVAFAAAGQAVRATELDAEAAASVASVIETIRPVVDEESLGSQPGRVLVVDDSPLNCALLRRRLEREGHDVAIATDGVEALETLERRAFDLVLLDFVMPRMNGYETLRRIKADPALTRMPVVMLSSIDDTDSAVRCLEMGADDYLARPYNKVVLRARISSCLERKRLLDREQAHLEQIRLEREESNRLLLNILPGPIAERLKQGPGVLADSFAEVTVAFADIVGFTRIAAEMSPEELIGFLNGVFTEFDGLAQRHRLEKIKTIGDAYMVVGGLPTPDSNHVERVAEMALAMLDAVRPLGRRIGRAVDLRIGINTGPVVAGVIGSSKFIYDLWGDTVNIASRMESLGQPGRIQVTGATRARLCERFDFEARGSVPVKGVGPMETWFLVGPRARGAHA